MVRSDSLPDERLLSLVDSPPNRSRCRSGSDDEKLTTQKSSRFANLMAAMSELSTVTSIFFFFFLESEAPMARDAETLIPGVGL